ncbi:MAG: hypothetical protein DMG66_01480 [Acidobacteria bacterium]|nr:MAG: hypothetical protein DMG66_01480 [Acidobacteriota bacterium]
MRHSAGSWRVPSWRVNLLKTKLLNRKPVAGDVANRRWHGPCINIGVLEGGIVSCSRIHKWLIGSLMVLALGVTLISPPLAAAERKVKQKVNPAYPELAKKMAVSGSVKVQLTVAPNGSVKSWKVIGGHPLLVDAAVDAVKRWKYEAAADESVELVEFKFSPAAE